MYRFLVFLENWFSFCLSCVKWGSVTSHFYELKDGVRQGGVLSPILFGIYIEWWLINLVDKTNIRCKIAAICTGIFLYADDIIFSTPFIQALQSLISLCESKLDFLCMVVNAKKSACLRFGPNVCACVTVCYSSCFYKHWQISIKFGTDYTEETCNTTIVHFTCILLLHYFKKYNLWFWDHSGQFSLSIELFKRLRNFRMRYDQWKIFYLQFIFFQSTVATVCKRGRQSNNYDVANFFSIL